MRIAHIMITPSFCFSPSRHCEMQCASKEQLAYHWMNRSEAMREPNFFEFL